jgi:hypothetical protein
MKQEFHIEPKIFTTGAFIQPMKVTDSEGKKIWLWYVSEFTDDSFLNGEVINPKENAKSEEELIAEVV